MPGVLIIEALAQAAGILLADQFDRAAQVALIVALDRVKIRRPVVPGDQLRLEVTDLRMKNSTARVQGVARVGEHVAAEAKILFAMVDADRAA
jgi:UDP-3-O-[3-hydroxymyristoyl] N-acetylglucosamine deacetylase / 3-hydroxyacyl-[acyl-carrier-protein] dehydratase